MAEAVKRILVVSQHFWPENFRINDIVAGFGEDGIEVDVLCGLPNYPEGEWFAGYKYRGPRRETYAGAQVFRAGEIRRKGNTGLRIFLNYVSFPFYALFSLPRLHGRKYSAVFCYNTSPVMMALPAIVYAKTHGIPLTTYVLDLWPDNLYSVLPVKNRFLRGVAAGVSRWHYRRATRLVAMGSALAETLAKMLAAGKKAPDISVIPQYSEDFYAEPIADAAVQKDMAGHFNILFAGNISPAQDLENLAQAMRLLQGRPGCEDVRAVILGGGMAEGALIARVAEYHLEEKIIFRPPVAPADVPRWTTAADALFVGLAKSENLGLTVPGKIPSYLAAGRPMLVAICGEGARVAEESGAALVCPAGDAAALAENIARLRALPAGRLKAMGQAGFGYYQKHFKRDTLLKMLEETILLPKKGT